MVGQRSLEGRFGTEGGSCLRRAAAPISYHVLGPYQLSKLTAILQHDIVSVSSSQNFGKRHRDPGFRCRNCKQLGSGTDY